MTSSDLRLDLCCNPSISTTIISSNFGCEIKKSTQ